MKRHLIILLAAALLLPLTAQATTKAAQATAPTQATKASLATEAQVSGKVFNDKNANGILDHNEKGMQGVAVSDGFSIVKTDKDGQYTIKLNPKARFVTVYTPSGYRSTNSFYTDVRALLGGKEATKDARHSGNAGFEFGLAPTPVYGCFAQMGDIEERTYANWIPRLKDYSLANNLDFIAVTGDICYADGLILMSKLVNTQTMQKRVVYTIGNHDLIKGNEDYLGNPYGEKNFEDCMGPSWYAFAVNGINFIVTPMMMGDAKPSYSLKDIQTWLKAYLDILPANAPLVIFNHDANEPIIPEGSNTKAFVYGHRHTHYRTITAKGVPFYCTMSPGKGSNDHSPAALRQFSFTADGISSSRLRYNPIKQHIAAHVANQNGRPVLAAAVYDYAADAINVTATFADGTSAKFARQDDMMWKADITASQTRTNYKITADFANGSRAIYNSSFEPALKWQNSIGSKAFLSNPLLDGDRIYVATVDDDLAKDCGVYALNAADGSRAWFYRTQNSVYGDIALCDGIIYAADADYNCYAINASDGSLKWKTAVGTKTFYPSLTEGVLVDAGKVFVGTGSNLCALDAKDGSVVWTNTHSHGSITNVNTSRTAGDALLTNGYWVGRFCYDKNTGAFLWENKEYQNRYSSCTPAVVGDTFVYSGYNTLMQVDAKTGKILKSCEHNTIFNVKSEPIIAGDKLFIGTSHNGVLAAKMEDLSAAWTFDCNAPLIYTSPYTFNAEKTVECTPAIWKDNVIIGANDGMVYCLTQSAGKMLWKVNIGLPVLNKPIISGDRMIIIDFAGNVFCYDLAELGK